MQTKLKTYKVSIDEVKRKTVWITADSRLNAVKMAKEKVKSRATDESFLRSYVQPVYSNNASEFLTQCQ